MCDWMFYLLSYPDLYVSLDHTESQVVDHFQTHGINEARIYGIDNFVTAFMGNQDEKMLLTDLLTQWSTWALSDDHYQHFVRNILRLNCRSMEISLLTDMFSFDREEMRRSVPSNIIDCLENMRTHQQNIVQRLSIPSSTRLSTRLSFDKRVPTDFDWKKYRQIHSRNVFEPLCGRFYWCIHKMITHPNLIQSVSDSFFPIRESPKVYIVSCLNVGGSKQYVDHLKIIFGSHKVSYQQIRHRDALLSISPTEHDVLWISHLYGIDISPTDLIHLLGTKRFQTVLLNIHDVTMWWWNDASTAPSESKFCHDTSILHAFNDNVCQVFDKVNHILCPSPYIHNLFLTFYPRPEKVICVPHPDICHYERKVMVTAPICDDRIHLCIPHGVYYLKGECAIRPLVEVISKYFADKVKLFLYGLVFENTRSLLSSNLPASSYAVQGMYHGDEFYEWVKRDGIHGFLVINDHPETYSFCFSKCINTGLPCLYSDIDGAIKDRAREHSIDGMYPLPKPSDDEKTLVETFQTFLSHITSFVNSSHERTTKETGSTRNMMLTVPPFYATILDRLHTHESSTSTESLIKRAHEYIEPFAIYFPQFYSIPENDFNFYPGMTDMVSLRELSKSMVQNQVSSFPLCFSSGDKTCLPDLPMDGVNGFYDAHRHKDMAFQQSRLAHTYGFKGFAIYHYWFSQNTITHQRHILDSLTRQFFDSDTTLPPDFKIFFIWANADWSDNIHYTGHDIRNTYEESHLIAHVKDLMPFFQHSAYYKQDNKPVLFIHYPWHFKNDEFARMTGVFDRICQESGFGGISIVKNRGIDDTSPIHEKDLYYRHQPSGSLLHKIRQPSVYNGGRDVHSWTVDMDTYYQEMRLKHTEGHKTIEVGFPSFNANARYFTLPHYKHINNFCTVNDGPEMFSRMCRSQMRQYAPSSGQRTGCQKIYLVNAWNEWGEEMKIEPSQQHFFGYLKSFHDELVRFSESVVSDKSERR